MDSRNLFLLLFMFTTGHGRQDNRCFLEGGGSTVSFFVKESLPVGSNLGELRVIGNPARNIQLTMNDSSAQIEPWTKKLILTNALDKEGLNGPSSLSFNVFCSRVGSDDPEFTIPVTIRVTDVNDNPPEFIGNTPYTLNISELTIVGTRIFRGIRASDRDQPGPFSTVEYSIIPGRYSDYVAFENPLEGSLVLTKHLDYETLRSFKVGIAARDQGAPSQESKTELIVNVLDADDQNPEFYYERYEAIIPQQLDGAVGLKLEVQPQDIQAFDKDHGLKSPVFYSFGANSENYKYFELNRNTGHIYLNSLIPEEEFVSPVTLVVKATQFDNPDRYAVTTLTVSKGGIYSSDLQFLQKEYQVRILENVPLNSVVATLLTNKPSDKRVHFSILENDDVFSISPKGDVIVRKVLDFETREKYTLKVLVTDGKRNDTAVIDVTLININDWDPRFKYPQYEFFVSNGNAFKGYVVGKMDVHDGDKGDMVRLDVRGPYSRVFGVTQKGELVIKNMKYLNGTEAHIVVVAEDSGIPPRRASVPVVVKFAKSNLKRSLVGLPEGINAIVILVFGLIITISFFVICCLSYYICKSKYRHRNAGKKMAANCILYNSNVGKEPSLPDEADKTNSDGNESPIVSDRSSSETLLSDHSTAMNPLNPRSAGRHRYPNNNAKVSPAPPPPTPSIHEAGLRANLGSNNSFRTPDSTLNLHRVLKGNIMSKHPTVTNIDSRIQWPRNSIPRRVKKLSWEDELNELNRDREISTLTETNRSPSKDNNPGNTQAEIVQALYF